jgi:cell division protein FtsB
MKPLIWVKNNWIILLVVAGVVYLGYSSLVGTNIYNKLMKNYSEQLVDHEKELRDLEKQQEEYKNIQNQMQLNFIKKMDELDKKYEAKFSEINSKRLLSKKTLIEEAKKDPTSLTSKVTEVFGIPEANNKQQR